MNEETEDIVERRETLYQQHQLGGQPVCAVQATRHSISDQHGIKVLEQEPACPTLPNYWLAVEFSCPSCQQKHTADLLLCDKHTNQYLERSRRGPQDQEVLRVLPFGGEPSSQEAYIAWYKS